MAEEAPESKFDSEAGPAQSGSSVPRDSGTDSEEVGMTNSWYWNTKPRARPGQYLRTYWSFPWRSNPMLHELLFVIVFALFAVISPEYIFRVTLNTDRPIPYQNYTTASMIFDLGVANELVENETFPVWLAALTGTVIPTVGMVLGGFFLGPKYDSHSIWCATCVANGAAAFYVQLFKLYVGRHRPNFFMKCGYNVSQESLQVNGGFGSLSPEELAMLSRGECKTEEARVSFPSGHSTFAFVGCTLVSLYMLGKIAIYADLKSLSSEGNGPSRNGVARRSADPSYRALGIPTFPVWKKAACIFSMSPLLYASWIACSRLVDNYHHPADIVAGALIGITSALFAHALWYPGVFSPWAGVPLMLLHDEICSEGNVD